MQDLNNLTVPAVLMSDLDNSTDSDDSSSIIENIVSKNITMTQILLIQHPSLYQFSLLKLKI